MAGVRQFSVCVFPQTSGLNWPESQVDRDVFLFTGNATTLAGSSGWS
jgi:hypothetical protein